MKKIFPKIKITLEPARAYAQRAYPALLEALCPGEPSHEANYPNIVQAVYCDRCLEDALARAWQAGHDSLSLSR